MTNKLVKDPFEVPLAIDDPEDKSGLSKVLKSLRSDIADPDILQGIKDESICCVVSSSASEPKNVEDATVSGSCITCGGDVWVSPSTKRVKKKKVFFCSTCIFTRANKLLAN